MFKMLIVDDEILIRYSLAMTFKGKDMIVRTAETGGEALAAIKEERFDICFLDLHLPDMGGLEILRAINSETPDTKVIIMSGNLMDKETRDVVRKHAVLFMEKPFDLDSAKAIVTLIRTRLETASVDSTMPRITLPPNLDRRHRIRIRSDKAIVHSTVSSECALKGVCFEAALKDISDGGMGLITEQPVEPGWMITLFDGEFINQGVIRWAAAIQPGRYKFGIQFSAAS
ncbi:MAG: response regulator [Nitrospirota bacterium]